MTCRTGCENPRPAERRRLPLRKKIFFSVAATCVFFAALELLLGGLGVGTAAMTRDPYVGFASYLPLFEKQRGEDGQEYWSTAPNKLDLFNAQQFPSPKAPGTCRIFCLGGSTTYGRPYDDQTSFCGWLREFLPSADPSRHWEVVNAGGISYASYRVANLTEELVRYEPDVFVVYCGHNEFLERRTYRSLLATPSAVRNAGVWLNRTRTYTVLAEMLGTAGAGRAASRSGQDMLPGEVVAVLDRSIGPEAYRRDDRLKANVLLHFRQSLERIIDIGQASGAEVVLVVPASNLKDCSPFKSEHRPQLEPDQRRRWDALVQRARHAQEDGRAEEALAAADEAREIDGCHAGLHYLRGRLLLQLGRHTEANAALTLARDEDVCPLRALTAITTMVQETAQRKDVPLVDFVRIVEVQSPHGIPGENVFLDHVHPTIETHRLLALALLDRLAASGRVQPVASWGEDEIQRITRRVEGRLDRAAHANALRNLAKVLAWAGKFDESNQLALRAAEDLPDDAHAQCLAGDAFYNQGRFDEAIVRYERSLQLAPTYPKAHYSLGGTLHRLGNLEQAAVHLEQAVQLQPNYALAHAALADVRFDQQRFPEAQRSFEQALRLNPDLTDALKGYGLLLARQGELYEAIGLFEHAVAVAPANAVLRNDLALLFIDAGEPERALELSREALDLDPFFARAHLTQGLAFQQQGRHAEAEAAYRQLIQANPDDPDARFNLASLLAAQRRHRDARREYAETLRIDPDYPGVQAALRRLPP
jgi:tetratricopeptide (TPR) repeat protein